MNFWKRAKRTVLRKTTYARLFVLVWFSASVAVILLFDGRTGSKHIGGVVNLGLAIGTVHALDACDDRWSLYREIVEEQNMAVALAYAGWIIGAAVATPSAIL